MSNKQKPTDSPLDPLTSESARQRWELFHRAISHAKESNNNSLLDADGQGNETETTAPNLTVVR
ncbi:MAG: hypothetical protein KJN77_03575 [Gammaproteobacteria bacterium]|nr:hypothetical protein [Gammaproteobacteria bacterium]